MRPDVPADWSTKLMGDVSSLKGRLGWQGLKAAHYQPTGPYVVSSAHFERERIDWDRCPHVTHERYERDQNIQLRTGDILLMKDGAALGKIAFVDRLPGPACLNSHLLLFRPINESYDPKFVYYCLGASEFQNYIKAHANGLTFLGISQEAVSRFPLQLPELSEQRRIAEILGTVDEAIRKTEHIIAKLNEMNQGLLTDLLARGIDEHGKLRDPVRNPDQFKDSPLGPVPAQWTVGRLEDWLLSAPKNGYSPQAAAEWTGWLMLGLGCLTKNGFVPSQLKNAPARDRRLQDAKLANGDLLVSRANTRELVGLVGRFEDVGVPCTYPDLMMRLVPDRDRASPAFLELVLRSAPLRRQIQAAAVGTSESMVKISGRIVRDLHVAMPSTKEQDRIVRSLVDARERLVHEERGAAKLQMLKQGLMEDLLTGRVRVTTAQNVSRRSGPHLRQLGLEL